jgi:undecaprenyl-phosphate galactose phosphotransferase
MADCLAFLISVLAAYYFSCQIKQWINPELPHPSVEAALRAYPALFFLPMLALLIGSYSKGHYSRFKGLWEEWGELTKLSLSILGVTIGVLYMSKISYSRAWILGSWALILISIPLVRCYTKSVLHKHGKWLTPAIILGSGQNAVDAALALESDFNMGYRVIGLAEIDRLNATVEANADGLPLTRSVKDPITKKEHAFALVHRKQDFLKIIEETRPYFVLAVEPGELSKYQSFVSELILHSKNFSIIPPLKGVPLIGAEISPIFRHDVLHLKVRTNLSSSTANLSKRIFDIFFATTALILLSPLLLVVSALIKCDGGSVFFSQRRAGFKGNTFGCLKFRSMRANSDEVLKRLLASDEKLRKEYLDTQKLKDDPRITRIGKIIRKYSIDELPQLFNVVLGQMSLVGPRPVRPDELLSHYGESADLYKSSPPGITGLWQVSGRNDLDYQTRVRLDAWYVQNQNFWGDLKLIGKTFGVVLKGEGAY